MGSIVRVYLARLSNSLLLDSNYYLLLLLIFAKQNCYNQPMLAAAPQDLFATEWW